MGYAIIRASGAQYQVSKGEEIDLFRLEGKKEGDEVTFKDVLFVADGAHLTVGQPLVLGAQVVGNVTKVFQGKKVRVATYKAKSRHRKVIGHRDQLTRVKIMDIIVGKKQNNKQ